MPSSLQMMALYCLPSTLHLMAGRGEPSCRILFTFNIQGHTTIYIHIVSVSFYLSLLNSDICKCHSYVATNAPLLIKAIIFH